MSTRKTVLLDKQALVHAGAALYWLHVHLQFGFLSIRIDNFQGERKLTFCWRVHITNLPAEILTFTMGSDELVFANSTQELAERIKADWEARLHPIFKKHPHERTNADIESYRNDRKAKNQELPKA